MTQEELCLEIWQSLGPMKRVAGRRKIDELTRSAIENWEGEALDLCQGDEENTQLISEVMLRSVERDQQEYGFFWMFLLQALAVAIIQELIKRWFKSARNRSFMVAWQAEMHE